MSATAVEVFVFDVCDTLFYSNTTYDFIQYVLAKKQLTSRQTAMRLLTRRWSPVYVGLAVVYKLTRQDWAKAAAVRLLGGIPRAELYELGQSFLTEFLASRQIARLHALLQEQQQTQARIILLSASLDPVVAALAQQLQVEYVSSQLDYAADGRATGKLLVEMGGHKHKALATLLGTDTLPDKLGVATDNFTDHALVSAASRRCVVVHSPAAKHFWQDLHPEFIEAYSA